MTDKKYFWLKLQNNFFEKEEIKIIESMPKGYCYINFYLKLLLKSIETEGKLLFRNIIPYTPDMLASITNTDIDTVKVASDLFIKLGLMEKFDDGTLFMLETKNMIGNESKWANYKRIERENKNTKLDNVQSNLDNVQDKSTNCPIDIDIELDLELDLESDLDKNIFSNENICNEPNEISIISLKNKFENCNCDCKRRAVFKINGINYCGQHARIELQKYNRLDLLETYDNNNSPNPKMLQLQKQAYLSFINFKDEELTNQWKELMTQWLEYKQSIKSAYKSDISIKTCFENLLKLSNSELVIAREIVNNSIGNGYKGLFALAKSNQNNTSTEKQDFFTINFNNFKTYETGALQYDDLNLLKKLADDSWVNETKKLTAKNFLSQAETKLLNDNQLSAIKLLLTKYKTGDWS